MLKTDLIKVLVRENGKLVAARFYGRDAEPDHSRVNVSGFAARLIVEALVKTGDKGRARSGLEKVLRENGFATADSAGRNFVFALDYLARERLAGRGTTQVCGNGNGRGGLVYRLVSP